jgi:hypothetical protein
MICIACGKEQQNLVNSHVVSNFIRKRLMGETKSDGSRKFSFRWVGRKDLPKQDLPKPRLMCKTCDNNLGKEVEDGIAELLMPDDVEAFDAWGDLPIRAHEIHGVFDDPLTLGVYDYPLSTQFMIEKFALSVAWRALHALAKDGEQHSCALLNSTRGANIDESVRHHLFSGACLQNTYDAFIYYWSPSTVNFITNNSGDMPFAWAELGDEGEFLGVTVMFAYWVIVWPLFERDRSQYSTKLDRLNKLCFMDWVAYVSRQLAS